MYYYYYYYQALSQKCARRCVGIAANTDNRKGKHGPITAAFVCALPFEVCARPTDSQDFFEALDDGL